MAKKSSRIPWPRERLELERNIALGAVLEPASNASYSSALQSYIDFCNQHHFAIQPTPNTLSYYVVYMSHHIKPSSVTSYLSGICNHLQHIYPEVRVNRKHQLVTNALRGCTKLRAIATSRKRAITRSELTAACCKLKPCEGHDEKLFLSLLLTGFHGLMRLGELTWPNNPTLRDHRKVSLRHSVKVTNTYYTFLLPFHKADRLFEGNRILIQSTATDDNPLTPFIDYLSSRDNLFPLHPQLWLRANGTIPTRQWFMRRLTKLFPGNIGGQSLRAGGATAYAEANVPLHIIQALGRWSSEAFKIYIRNHPALLAASLRRH